MEDVRQHFECEDCGAEYSLQTDLEIDPSYCPFCGDSLEEELEDDIEWEEDDE